LANHFNWATPGAPKVWANDGRDYDLARCFSTEVFIVQGVGAVEQPDDAHVVASAEFPYGSDDLFPRSVFATAVSARRCSTEIRDLLRRPVESAAHYAQPISMLTPSPCFHNTTRYSLRSSV